MCSTSRAAAAATFVSYTSEEGNQYDNIENHYDNNYDNSNDNINGHCNNDDISKIILIMKMATYISVLMKFTIIIIIITSAFTYINMNVIAVCIKSYDDH